MKDFTGNEIKKGDLLIGIVNHGSQGSELAKMIAETVSEKSVACKYQRLIDGKFENYEVKIISSYKLYKLDERNVFEFEL